MWGEKEREQSFCVSDEVFYKVFFSIKSQTDNEFGAKAECEQTIIVSHQQKQQQ